MRLPPLLAKTTSLALIVLLLLAALARIGHLVDERRAFQADAELSVRQSLADPQVVLGPFLHRQCTEQWDVVSEKNGERSVHQAQRTFALTAVPSRLGVSGDFSLDARHRGLFKVNTYGARLAVSAEWPQGAALAASRSHAGSRLQCDAPTLSLALGDARGIRSARLTVDGLPRGLEAGSRHGLQPRGVHALLGTEWRPQDEAVQPIKATLDLELVGTGSWAWVPAAGQTEVALRADWPHPSFAGRFLPSEWRREARGVAASWRVSGLATDAAAALARGAALCSSAQGPARGGECLDTLAVSFIDPVNIYVLSDRAIKYGLLFIAVTLGAVLLVETLARRPVHAVQYALVGSALTLFFLLLLGLSEHLPFAQAYLAAAGCCVALLAYYGAHLLGGAQRGFVFGLALAGLYGAMYLLLQMEQTALVVGSLLLFSVLAAVMVVTRRVDWFALFGSARRPPVDAALP
jgi:inner membrane protein